MPSYLSMLFLPSHFTSLFSSVYHPFLQFLNPFLFHIIHIPILFYSILFYSILSIYIIFSSFSFSILLSINFLIFFSPLLLPFFYSFVHPRHLSPVCMDFMRKLLVKDPNLRMSTGQALRHPFITGQVTIAPALSIPLISFYLVSHHGTGGRPICHSAVLCVFLTSLYTSWFITEQEIRISFESSSCPSLFWHISPFPFYFHSWKPFHRSFPFLSAVHSPSFSLLFFTSISLYLIAPLTFFHWNRCHLCPTCHPVMLQRLHHLHLLLLHGG